MTPAEDENDQAPAPAPPAIDPPTAVTDGAAAAGVGTPPDDVVAALPAAEIEGKDWSKGALIIVGKHPIAKDEKRPIIVVEEWSDPTIDESGHTPAGEEGRVKADDYPTRGDLYVRTTEDVTFPDKAPVVMIGGTGPNDVQQLAPWGFSPDPRWVCVGPGHPWFAAANIAWQRGARDIEIVGLTDLQKERLQPFIDDLPVNKIVPAADVKITVS